MGIQIDLVFYLRQTNTTNTNQTTNKKNELCIYIFDLQAKLATNELEKRANSNF